MAGAARSRLATSPRHAVALTAVLAALALLAPAPAAAQQPKRQQSIPEQLRNSQLRLEQIRQERSQLQQEMQQIQSHVKDVSGELANIERQVAISNKAMEELNFQASTVEASINNVTAELDTTRKRMASQKAMLDQRLRTIYERGPLNTLEVLLSAHSFGELLNRYKYMHLIALHDRAMVQEIAHLEADLSAQEAELRQRHDQLGRVRQEKMEEMRNLRALETQHQRALRSYRSQAREKQGRLTELQRNEAQITKLVADLERRRKEENRRRAAAGEPARAGTITTRDLGSLDWPVDGRLVYRFGPERKPNGVILRWNGIGIAARAGTPVHAVESGRVVLAGPFEGYGPSVMISHGGGYYTLYLYLQAVTVKQGQRVQTGQEVGTVGGTQTPQGAHIEFQVRAPVNGAPVAVDPLSWLRNRAGGS